MSLIKILYGRFLGFSTNPQFSSKELFHVTEISIIGMVGVWYWNFGRNLLNAFIKNT